MGLSFAHGKSASRAEHGQQSIPQIQTRPRLCVECHPFARSRARYRCQSAARIGRWQLQHLHCRYWQRLRRLLRICPKRRLNGTAEVKSMLPFDPIELRDFWLEVRLKYALDNEPRGPDRNRPPGVAHMSRTNYSVGRVCDFVGGYLVGLWRELKP